MIKYLRLTLNIKIITTQKHTLYASLIVIEYKTISIIITLILIQRSIYKNIYSGFLGLGYYHLSCSIHIIPPPQL